MIRDIYTKTPKYYKFILREGWKHKIYDKFNKSQVIDVGCGKGKLLNRYKNWIGIDVEKRNSNKNFRIGSIMKIPFRSNIFDLLVCNHVLEHINKKDFLGATKEINRVIKKGGYVFITGPNPMNPFYWDTFSHINPVTLRTIVARFENLNFEVIIKGFTLFRRLPYIIQYLLFLFIPHIPSEYYIYAKKK